MDPLFSNGVGLAVVLIVVLKVLVTFVFLLVSVLLMIWFERKIISDMQNRIGPNRAGPWGLLQSLADGIKIFFKEDLLPEQADAAVFRLAPYVSTVTAFAAFAVIPVGGSLSIAGHDTFLQLADPPVGVLFLLAMSSIAVYGVMLAGWSSGSKYPLLGSVRASAQMVSYEAAMGLSVVAVVLAAGTLSTHAIVLDQAGRGPGGILPNWNVITLGGVPFLIYLIAATAEINRPPFALFYLAEFMNTITVSAVAVTLFFGGPSGPVYSVLPRTFWPIFWFFLKLLVFLFCYVWLRASVPRFRYDQLMDLGWKRLIPAALFWLLLIAAIQIGRDQGWNPSLVLGVGVLAGLAVMGALALAVRTSRLRADDEAQSLEASR